jgi:hypothetical protein
LPRRCFVVSPRNDKPVQTCTTIFSLCGSASQRRAFDGRSRFGGVAYDGGFVVGGAASEAARWYDLSGEHSHCEVRKGC